jgi:HAD superfamily phosphatase (TIGR01668 family)
LASNNKRNRVEKVGKSLGIDAIFGALKPRKKAFVSAMHLMQLNYDEIAVIGDQIFTDIYGGNRLNMYTIFVKPIGMNDYLFVRMKRPFEDIILSKYREQDFETKDRRLMWKEDSARKILRKRI